MKNALPEEERLHGLSNAFQTMQESHRASFAIRFYSSISFSIPSGNAPGICQLTGAPITCTSHRE